VTHARQSNNLDEKCALAVTPKLLNCGAATFYEPLDGDESLAAEALSS